MLDPVFVRERLDEVKTGLRRWGLVPPAEDVCHETLELFEGFSALGERTDALERVRILRGGGKDEYVGADEAAYSMGLSANTVKSGTLVTTVLLSSSDSAPTTSNVQSRIGSLARAPRFRTRPRFGTVFVSGPSSPNR